MFFTRKRHHGGAAHAVADDEHVAELAERAFFLLPDHAFDRRGAAPAIFLGPVQASPAGIGLFLLPGSGHLQNVGVLELGAAERGFLELLLILLRCVGSDPGLCLGAERGFLRGVVEIHGWLFLSRYAPRMLRAPRKRRAADPGSIQFVPWVRALRGSVKDAAPRPGHG